MPRPSQGSVNVPWTLPLPWPGALHTVGVTMGVGMVVVRGSTGHNL